MKLSKLPLPIKLVLLVIVSIIDLFITTIKFIDKLFISLPKITRIIIVYSLITIVIYNHFNPVVLVQTVETETETIVYINNEEFEEEIEEEQTIQFASSNETNIFNKCIDLGLTENQALMVVSISRHETGNWTSKAFTKNNNFGGIMTNGATQIKNYETYEQGLTDFVSILKNYYFDLGLNTIEQIGAKYCPVGAKNDPNGLNKNWVSGVSTFYNNYLLTLQ